MLKPELLKEGDTIYILSTAKKIKYSKIKPTIEILNQWGFNIVVGDTIGNGYHQFAGTDKERLADIQKALNETNVKAIFCAKGGYGTTRIIDKIDFTKFQKTPKWIIGYSDITALHQHIINNFGICTLHATMPINIGILADDKSINSIKVALTTGKLKYEYEENNQLNEIGSVKGNIIGGNLTLLNNIIGTKSDFNTQNKILFIEDVDEYLMKIDRKIVGLDRAGKFSDLKGLIVGSFTNTKDNRIPFGMNEFEIIKEVTKKYKYPKVFGFPIGHTSRNYAIIEGGIAELEITKKKVKLKIY